ncbi:MAG: DUF899 domain-containing protein [Pseudomonadales bacterium]|nr:DUF899 domain-containing protein [Pseudomonadales bacterium]
MNHPEVVDRQTWLAARLELLAAEKAFSRARDALTRQRQTLPWVRVDENYQFEGAAGNQSLAELFGNRSQLIVQHYMYAPGWQEGCKSCAFWADQFDPALPHLAARDVAFAAVSQAPYTDFAPFKKRMGWQFPWVSSAANSFSNDYLVCYSPDQIAAGDTFYNYTRGMHYGEHAPGISVFAKDGDGAVYHTYSCYARGLDMLNGAYHLLDLVPKGRDEADLPASMAWLKLHDQYE